MSHLSKAAQPVREPPLSKEAMVRARQLGKHAIVTATESDNCFAHVCPCLAHMIIVQQELDTASHEKVGPKDGAAAKALASKTQVETDRLSVVKAHGKQKAAAINRRKKNQAAMEDKDAPLAAADPLNRMATLCGTIKQKATCPPGTPARGPPPPGGMQRAEITTALRPMTLTQRSANMLEAWGGGDPGSRRRRPKGPRARATPRRRSTAPGPVPALLSRRPTACTCSGRPWAWRDAGLC